MTKQVRVENADNSEYKIVVWTEDLVDGVWVRRENPTMLGYPTSLAALGITSTRRLVIEEEV